MKFTPDLLTFSDGEKVVSAADWQRRREELIDILCREEYGYSPEKPQQVTGTVVRRAEECCSGHAVLEEIWLSFNTEKGVFHFPIKFFVPKNGRKNPLIILINFRPDAYDMYFPIEEIIDSGFAFATVCYQDITSDDDDMKNGIAGEYARGEESTAWGKIGMWAFGASRILDYLETREEVDASNVAIAGHSRLGKTALWCAAQDERFRFAISNDSGCGGAALEQTKHEGCDSIATMALRFPYWFCQNRHRYADKQVARPFDQHFLLAAIAPRFVAVGSASLDAWADPYSEQLACVAASDAWEVQGKKGYIGSREPAQTGESFSEGSISYHLRDGIHFMGRSDWLAYMRFIGRNLK